MSLTRPTYFFMLSISLLTAGCGGQGDRPDMGEVEGIIAVDGVPTPGLQVIFYQKGFPESIGVTDEMGGYLLRYVHDIPGAAVGMHEVRIRRASGTGSTKAPPLPARYNGQTELKREVKPGKNTIDFELSTKETTEANL